MAKKNQKQKLSLAKYLSLIKYNSYQYKTDSKICVTKPDGKFYKIRTWVSYLFFIIFVSLPFIYINNKPIFLFNFFKSEYIVYSQVFEPSEFYYFGITLILFAAFILLFTSLFGRLFCGWVCPQTVLMEMLFRKIEYFFENPKVKNYKYLKNSIFFIISFIISNILLSYIIGYKQLFNILSDTENIHYRGLISVLLFSGLIFYVFAFYRQKACLNLCPYGRLQNVLFDKNTLLIAYDYKRGEPRGVIENGESNIKIGDCIDCNYCVKVCPMGIDIRNGIQRECIMCTSCIDACNGVMKNLKKQKSLIKFSTENYIENRIKPKINYRVVVNVFLMIFISYIIFYIIFSR